MNIIGKRKIWFSISLLLIISGIISLFVWGLKPSIDFTGGTLMEIEGNLDKTKVSEIAEKEGVENVIVVQSGENKLLLRAKFITEDTHQKIKESLLSLGEFKEIRFETVGPSISKEIVRRTIIFTSVASLFIILYVAWSFRSVPKPANPWRFGITAIIALIHDALIILGVFSVLGHFKGVEVDSMFVTAVLTVVGFSVHDTVVIYDRVRENLKKYSHDSFENNTNRSIVEMIPRDLTTSFCAFIILLALFLIGGETIRYFVLVLLIGILVGTYSSIMDAAPLMVVWHNFAEKRVKSK